MIMQGLKAIIINQVPFHVLCPPDFGRTHFSTLEMLRKFSCPQFFERYPEKSPAMFPLTLSRG